MIVLASWSSVWVTARFDPRTGRLRRRLSLVRRRGTSVVAGYFALERSPEGANIPAAIYSCGTYLQLHVAGHSWRLPDPDLAFTHTETPAATASVFGISRSGATVFTCTYRHPFRSAMASFDPTHDTIDHENEHFLAFIAANGADPEWQAAILKTWQPQSPGA